MPCLLSQGQGRALTPTKTRQESGFGLCCPEDGNQGLRLGSCSVNSSSDEVVILTLDHPGLVPHTVTDQWVPQGQQPSLKLNQKPPGKSAVLMISRLFLLSLSPRGTHFDSCCPGRYLHFLQKFCSSQALESSRFCVLFY